MALRIQRTAEVTSVSDFVTTIVEMKYNKRRATAYRGQSSRRWNLVPKLFRQETKLYYREKEAIRDLIAAHPDEFNGDQTMFDRLVRMQHFGFPTRLLDVTINPLVALWFACEHIEDRGIPAPGSVFLFFIDEERRKYFDSYAVSCMSNLSNLTHKDKIELYRNFDELKKDKSGDHALNHLIYYVRKDVPHFDKDISRDAITSPVYVTPKLSNKRIIAQSGSFILFGPRRSRDPEVYENLNIKKILIPDGAKDDIREQLGILGIHRATLFPEIEKAAENIMKIYSDNYFIDDELI